MLVSSIVCFDVPFVQISQLPSRATSKSWIAFWYKTFSRVDEFGSGSVTVTLLDSCIFEAQLQDCHPWRFGGPAILLASLNEIFCNFPSRLSCFEQYFLRSCARTCLCFLRLASLRALCPSHATVRSLPWNFFDRSSLEIFFASYHYLILFSLLSRLGDLINRSTSRWLRQSHRSGRSGSHLRRQNAHRLLAISQAPDQSKTRVPASRKLRHEMEKGVRSNFISSKRSREGRRLGRVWKTLCRKSSITELNRLHIEELRAQRGRKWEGCW